MRVVKKAFKKVGWETMNTKMILLCGLMLGLSQAILCEKSQIEFKDDYFVKERLLRVDQLIFIPPVKTVSWLQSDTCNSRYGAYALVGGQPFDNIDFRIYKLTPADTLLHVADGTHGQYVLSSDWCCINGVPYIAIAGVANAEGYEVEIFRFDPVTALLNRVAYYTHGGNVHSVAWLCDCSATGSSYLAIGGDASVVDRADVRVLFVPTLTTTAVALQATSSKIHGAPVYSVDWCASNTISAPLLAIGGRASSLECGINIRIFSLDCATGYLYPYAQKSFVGGLVNTVKWCCPANHDSTLFLVAGGSKSLDDCANIRLYCISPDTQYLMEYAKTCNSYQPIITAVDWNPACRCSYITAGGACAQDTPVACNLNLFVYKKGRHSYSSHLKLVTEEQFNQTITSLAWFHQTGSLYSYLLVGGESNKEISEGMSFNPECQKEPMVILYKTTDCKSKKTECVPPICLRTPLR